MIVLAVDTSLAAVQVAVADGGGRALAQACEQMARGHQERLAPLAAEVMARAGVRPGAVGRVVTTCGPGSFTGLRVGLAFAKAYALALGAPCVGMGTLEALALSAPEGDVAAVIAAPHDRAYLQRFRDGRALAEPRLVPVDEAREAASGALAIGPGAALLGGDPERAPWPDVAALARHAALFPSLSPAAPLYLREVGALTLAERRAAAQASDR